MRIGQLADQVGLNTKTIRYYEQVGLLREPDRTPAGYRIYEPDDVDRLAFIRRAQQLDLRLDEIAEILTLRDSGQPPCDYVQGVAEARLADVERRIAEMQHARDELRTLLARVDRLPSSDARFCDLIEHHHQDGGDEHNRQATV